MKQIYAIFLAMIMLFSCVACSENQPQYDDYESIFHEESTKNTTTENITTTTTTEAIVPIYPVTINVECYMNLVFSKYDVDIYVDGTLLGNHDHGATKTYMVELDEGDHNITFEKEDDPSVDGQDNFNISASTEITYRISCYNNQITVEQESFLEKKNDSANENATSSTLKDNTTTKKVDLIKVPSSSDTFSSKKYTEVVKQLEEAGFKNIRKEGIYDLSDGFFDSLFVHDIESVSIDGKTSFAKGEEFDKNAIVIVKFRDLETNNPNIEFKKYTAAELINQLEENALTAKENHENEYVAITGKISSIDASGKYFAIAASNDEWEFDTIQCNIKTDEQKEQLKKLKKGQSVTVKGKITLVGEVLGYSMDIISFS